MMKHILDNIPIFRAKKIDSSEYIIGYLEEHNTNDFYISLMPNEVDAYKIDPTTLAIHFPSMVDSNGNKIFASLQEDGKGGDKFILGDKRLKYIANIYHNQLMGYQQGTYGSRIGQGYAETNQWKVIGIQE